MLRHLSRAISSPSPSPNRHILNGDPPPDAAGSRPAYWQWLVVASPGVP